MQGKAIPEPTERELRILRILWERGEATVREVYEELRTELGIVQNTVQAFLRTMTDKGLVAFRKAGRTFVYRPATGSNETRSRLVGTVLTRAFGGAVDELVASAVALRKPTTEEIARLRQLLDAIETKPGEAP